LNQLKEISAKYLFEHAKKGLNVYETPEKERIITILLEDIFQLSKIDIMVDTIISWDTTKQHTFESALNKLNQHTPIQYVVGKAFFYDAFYNLNVNTLIPRPETEELVQLIINENKHIAPYIIDIGTGSGCIAISLSKHVKKSTVVGLDISRSAIEMARKNNEIQQSSVTFVECDFLSSINTLSENFDIIVSNPPYVLESEKESMRANVLEFEPHLALFVPDSNALVYYEALLHFAKKSLNKTGFIYAEINEQKGAEILQLSEKYAFSNGKIIKDSFGKDRFFKAQKI
jgi:release factor glutamine methyltransferase